MTDTVLFVDDEDNVLHSIKRLLEDKHFEVLTTTSGKDALDILKAKPDIALIVSDHRMPGMTGVEVLEQARGIVPDTVKILLTGYADLETAIDAINKGEVYRFIQKPWNDSELINAVAQGVKHYNFIKTLKKADDASLLSLAQTIELKDPYTRGHCDRVAMYALIIAGAMNFPEDAKESIKHGSWLHDCGKIGVSENILNKNSKLDDEEVEIIKKHPAWGHDVAIKAQLSETVKNIILYHHEKYGGNGYPTGIKGTDIPIEARIVAVADTFDALITDRPYRSKYSDEAAIDIIISMKGESFDPEITDLFISCVSKNISQRENIFGIKGNSDE